MRTSFVPLALALAGCPSPVPHTPDGATAPDLPDAGALASDDAGAVPAPLDAGPPLAWELVGTLEVSGLPHNAVPHPREADRLMLGTLWPISIGTQCTLELWVDGERETHATPSEECRSSAPRGTWGADGRYFAPFGEILEVRSNAGVWSRYDDPFFDGREVVVSSVGRAFLVSFHSLVEVTDPMAPFPISVPIETNGGRFLVAFDPIVPDRFWAAGDGALSECTLGEYDAACTQRIALQDRIGYAQHISTHPLRPSAVLLAGPDHFAVWDEAAPDALDVHPWPAGTSFGRMTLDPTSPDRFVYEGLLDGKLVPFTTIDAGATLTPLAPPSDVDPQSEFVTVDAAGTIYAGYGVEIRDINQVLFRLYRRTFPH